MTRDNHQEQKPCGEESVYFESTFRQWTTIQGGRERTQVKQSLECRRSCRRPPCGGVLLISLSPLSAHPAPLSAQNHQPAGGPGPPSQSPIKDAVQACYSRLTKTFSQSVSFSSLNLVVLGTPCILGNSPLSAIFLKYLFSSVASIFSFTQQIFLHCFLRQGLLV